jgi:DNA-binding transcriptional MerR regulator
MRGERLESRGLISGAAVHIFLLRAYNMLYVNVNCGKPQSTMITYTITELASEFDITARAIRFYEDRGLLSPQREGVGGRTRVYSARERTRLKLTLRGKRLGLTLAEIKDLVDMYESPKDTGAQMGRFLKILAAHRENLEQQRVDIEETLAEISVHESECRRMLDARAATPKRKAAAAQTER